MDSLNRTADTYLSFLKNEYVSAIVIMLVIIYSSLIPSVVPAILFRLMDKNLVKVAVMFAFLYVTGRNATIALVSSLAIVVVMHLYRRSGLSEHMTDVGSYGCGCGKKCDGTKCDNGITCGCGCVNKGVNSSGNNGVEGFCSTGSCGRGQGGAANNGVRGYQDTPTIGEKPAGVNYRLSDQFNDDGASMEPLIERELSEEAGRSIGVEIARKQLIEEERVNKVLSKVTELKAKLKRDLTAQELKDLCEETLSGDFSDEALQMLRSEVDYRQQTHGRVKGYDEFPVYATVGSQ